MRRTSRHDLCDGIIAMCVAAATTTAAAGVDYDDGNGRLWRQLPTTINLTWDEVATVCPTDGLTPATGSAGGVDLTGWTWATPEQVGQLYSYFAPDILATPCIGGPAYTLAGIVFLGGGYIDPTFAYYSEFGANLYTNGWTAELDEFGDGVMASASASYPVFDGAFCLTQSAATDSRPLYTGVWLWKATIAGDTNGDGLVDLTDLGVVLSTFGMTSEATRADGDFDADGDVDLSDVGILLANYGCC